MNYTIAEPRPAKAQKIGHQALGDRGYPKGLKRTRVVAQKVGLHVMEQDLYTLIRRLSFQCLAGERQDSLTGRMNCVNWYHRKSKRNAWGYVIAAHT